MANGISSSNLEFRGNRGLILEDPGTLKISQTGMATCTAVFKIVKSRYLSLPRIGSSHPIFEFLTLESSEIALSGAWAVLTGSYAGLQAEYDDSKATYELVVGLSEEPIETHPYWEVIGGTAKEPENGAIYEKVANGVPHTVQKGGNTAPSNMGYLFKGFELTFDPVTKTAKTDKMNAFAKITHYLSACQITWKRNSTRRVSAATIEKVGFIDTPKGPAPRLPGGRNWLNMGLTQSQSGQVYQVSEEWRASDLRKWNSLIYKPF